MGTEANVSLRELADFSWNSGYSNSTTNGSPQKGNRRSGKQIEFDKRTIGILREHCAIGSFPDKFGLPTSITAKAA